MMTILFEGKRGTAEGTGSLIWCSNVGKASGDDESYFADLTKRLYSSRSYVKGAPCHSEASYTVGRKDLLDERKLLRDQGTWPARREIYASHLVQHIGPHRSLGRSSRPD
jgi:hypothetical protein